MAFGIGEILTALLPSLLAVGGGALANKFAGGSQGGQSGGNFLTGYPAGPGSTERIPRFDVTQGNAINQILGQGLQGLQGLGKGFDFGPIEEQARTGFAQQTIPSIAERFTAMGGQRSSAFPQILGQAGAGLEQSLASLKSDVGLQQQGHQQDLILRLLGLGLTPKTENIYNVGQPRTTGLLENLIPGLGQGLGAGLSSLMQGSGGGLSGLSGLASSLGNRASGGCSGGSCSMNRNAPISGQTTFGQNYGGFGSGFANPNLYSPGMTNLLNTRF